MAFPNLHFLKNESSTHTVQHYAVKMCLHLHMVYIQTDAVSTRSRCRPCYMEQLLWDTHTHTHIIRRVEL